MGGGSRPGCAFDSRAQTFRPPRSSEPGRGTTTSKARSPGSGPRKGAERRREEGWGGGVGVMCRGTEDSRYCQHPSASPGVMWEQARQRE